MRRLISDQGLHCLQIVYPFSLEVSKSHNLTYLKLKFSSFKIYCGGGGGGGVAGGGGEFIQSKMG